LQAAPAQRFALHLQRAQDQLYPGADRRHRRRVLRLAHRRHGVPDQRRGRPHECRHGLGHDRRCSTGRLAVLLADRAGRAEPDPLGSVVPAILGRLAATTNTGRLRMRKLLGAAVLAAALAGWTAAGQAADKLTLQLKWVTQAQFAGYYVAKDKG